MAARIENSWKHEVLPGRSGFMCPFREFGRMEKAINELYTGARDVATLLYEIITTA